MTRKHLEDVAGRPATVEARPAGAEALLIERVCAACCDYYKPGKIESERCGGFRWLAAALAARRLHPPWEAALRETPSAELAFDRLLDRAICELCPFRASDCDYRDPAPPAGTTPCGGLRTLDRLLARGLVEPGDLCGNPEKGP